MKLDEAFDFIRGVLEPSTEYSIIATDLDGRIRLWNQGARRLYGYEPEEAIGRLHSSALHVEEDVAAGLPERIAAAALRDGKWEGTVTRVRKDGGRFPARVVKTPRVDADGSPIGFLLISKDISEEQRLTKELQMGATERPDLILLDRHLPDMTGDEILLALRTKEETATIPVVVVSGDTATVRAGAAGLGVIGDLTKPFDIHQLLAYVDRTLGSPP